MGRPLAPIDAEQVYKLARVGCIQGEIADILGCSVDTLQRRFAVEITRGRAERKMSLRRAQMIRAVRDRSDAMLIHLGKVDLGQDTKAQVVGTPDGDWLGDDDGNPV